MIKWDRNLITHKSQYPCEISQRLVIKRYTVIHLINKQCVLLTTPWVTELVQNGHWCREGWMEGGQQGIRMNFGAELADSNLTLIYASAAGCKLARKFIPDWSRGGGRLHFYPPFSLAFLLVEELYLWVSKS